MKHYDAVISGAGPAGCSAALFLARRGHHVLLLDKARFPRDKTCGDGVTAKASSLLEEMGVLEGIRRRCGDLPVFDGVTVSFSPGLLVQGRITPFKGASSHIIPRKELDNSILDCIKEQPSITFLDGTQVIDLIMEGSRVKGVTSSKGEYFGRIIIAADGFYSPIAKRLGLLNRQKEHLGFAIRAYFSDVEGLTDAIELHYDQSMAPGYGWVFPVGENRANVGVGVITRFREQRGLKKLFEQFVSTNKFVATRLNHATIEPGSLKAWPLPLGSFQGKRGRGNALLAGDAGSFVDPLTGEGIYYALQSGKYAAEAASRALSDDESNASSYYEAFWRKEFLFDEFTMGYALQTLLQHRFILAPFLTFASKKQSRADLLAAVIAHRARKIDLLKMFVPWL